MRIIKAEEADKWNEVIKSFSNWDIYYLNEYAKSFQIHGDGEPLLVCHEDNEAKLAYVMMQQDISELNTFKGKLKEKYYDWTTPYGYGGPLVEGNISDRFIDEFIEELTNWCIHNKVVSQFFRFNPLTNNHNVFSKCSDIVKLKQTVYIDTSSEEAIYSKMTRNNRKQYRRARKNQVKIISDKGERIEDFKKIYIATMNNNRATEYYYFRDEYYKYLINNMQDNIIFFYALYEDIPVSASMYFYNDKYIHYHLSGTLPMYRHTAATTLVITEAAKWASSKGISCMHLGGGVEKEDSLFTFKKNFNRSGLLDFYIGRNIFDFNTYNKLIEIRQLDLKFNPNSKFLIKYRS